MDTTNKLPVTDNSCHSTPNLAGSLPDTGFPQTSPQTPLSFQQEAPVITSQQITPSLLPRTSGINLNNFQSTNTGTTPGSRNAKISRNVPHELYGKPYF